MASATPLDDLETAPEPKEIRAFLLDGSKGIAFHRGVWHRHVYPLGDFTDLIAILPDGRGHARPSAVPARVPVTRPVDYLQAHGIMMNLVIRGWEHHPGIIGEVLT